MRRTENLKALHHSVNARCGRSVAGTNHPGIAHPAAGFGTIHWRKFKEK
jgi:hypothetical protein